MNGNVVAVKFISKQIHDLQHALSMLILQVFFKVRLLTAIPITEVTDTGTASFGSFPLTVMTRPRLMHVFIVNVPHTRSHKNFLTSVTSET